MHPVMVPVVGLLLIVALIWAYLQLKFLVWMVVAFPARMEEAVRLLGEMRTLLDEGNATRLDMQIPLRQGNELQHQIASAPSERDWRTEAPARRNGE